LFPARLPRFEHAFAFPFSLLAPRHYPPRRPPGFHEDSVIYFADGLVSPPLIVSPFPICPCARNLIPFGPRGKSVFSFSCAPGPNRRPNCSEGLRAHPFFGFPPLFLSPPFPVSSQSSRFGILRRCLVFSSLGSPLCPPPPEKPSCPPSSSPSYVEP